LPPFMVAGEVVATMDDDGSDVRVDLSTPQFIDDVRTLNTGDLVRIPPHREWCQHPMPGGFLCSRTRGHDPHDYPHTATSAPGYLEDDGNVGKVLAVMDPEAPEVASTDRERELDAEVERLTSTVRDVERQLRLAQRASESAQDMIGRIREYAIEKMRDGTICRDGTREFLEHFDLPTWERTYRIQVLVTVDRTAEDPDDAEAEVLRDVNSAVRYLDGYREVEHNDTEDIGDDD
jgi:hypothetical protein